MDNVGMINWLAFNMYKRVVILYRHKNGIKLLINDDYDMEQ